MPEKSQHIVVQEGACTGIANHHQICGALLSIAAALLQLDSGTHDPSAAHQAMPSMLVVQPSCVGLIHDLL